MIIDLIAHNMAPIMFAALVVFLLLGYPVAFSLAFVGISFGILGIWLGELDTHLFGLLPERMWGIMSNDTLLAIPFFTFMGLILERSGMAEDLLDTVGQLFGPIRGGLAYAVVFVGALLAATTGVVAASVIAMGLISLPIMLRYGYDRRLASGVIAASGTLAQIIPPSLVLIIMADQLGRSVGDMYAGAFIPGLVLAAFYAGYVLHRDDRSGRRRRRRCRSKRAPSAPASSRCSSTVARSQRPSVIGVTKLLAWARCRGRRSAASSPPRWSPMSSRSPTGFLKLNLLSRLAQQAIIVLMPPLALIFLVLGTIFIGLATPTEGGAMGAVGALLLAAAKGRLNLTMTKQALEVHRQAFGLRAVHPDRRPGVLAHLLWRRRS